MQTPTDITGVILAGGRSERFGSPKPEAVLRGRTLIQRVFDTLSADCTRIAVAGSARGLGAPCETVADAAAAPSGPLAGVLAALEWASRAGAAWVVTSPCDTPLLPHGLARRLTAAAETSGAQAAIALGPDGPHPLIGAWRPGLAPALAAALEARHPPAHTVARSLGATEVALPSWSLLNINEPADLDRAARNTFAGGPLGLDGAVFGFEAEFARTLRCIPMSVRARLDRVGVKLTLRQWSRLTVDQRHELARLPCDAAVDIADWRAHVRSMATVHPDPDMKDLAVDETPEWGDLAAIPGRVAALAAERGQPALMPEAWRSLSPLQRFALVKLTRDAHENENFVPAMREFGLV